MHGPHNMFIMTHLAPYHSVCGKHMSGFLLCGYEVLNQRRMMVTSNIWPNDVGLNVRFT